MRRAILDIRSFHLVPSGALIVSPSSTSQTPSPDARVMAPETLASRIIHSDPQFVQLNAPGLPDWLEAFGHLIVTTSFGTSLLWLA